MVNVDFSSTNKSVVEVLLRLDRGLEFSVADESKAPRFSSYFISHDSAVSHIAMLTECGKQLLLGDVFAKVLDDQSL